MRIYRRSQIDDVREGLRRGEDQFLYWNLTHALAYRRNGDDAHDAACKAFFTTARLFCLATKELEKRDGPTSPIIFAVPSAYHVAGVIRSASGHSC